MEFTLYPWQEECLDAWFSNHCHGLVNVVTGAGKTVLALAATERLKHVIHGTLRVKIVVPTTFLLSQWRSSLPVSAETGCYYGARKDRADQNFMIYVINSARYALARHVLEDLKKGYSVLLIADECHHYTSVENRKIFDFLPHLNQMPGHYYSLGLSATPETAEYESVLVPALGREIYRYGFSDAIRKNTISTFAIFQIAISLNAEEMNHYIELSDRLLLSIRRLTARFPALKSLEGKQFFGILNRLASGSDPVGSGLANTTLNLTYQRKALIYNAGSRLSCACRLLNCLDSKSKVIIFGERIQQADELYHLLIKQFPGQVERSHSKMGRQAQKNALERYRSGEVRILISCRSLDEGLNVSAANVGIVLSSASVERQRIQRLGRILRHQEGKNIACLYYLHLDHDTEPHTFFSQMPEEAFVFDLSYSEQTDSFSFPKYEEYAVQVLQKFRGATFDKTIWREVEKCLMNGMLRPDWLLGKIDGDEALEQRIDSARTLSEKNYWICMKYMSTFAGFLNIVP